MHSQPYLRFILGQTLSLFPRAKLREKHGESQRYTWCFALCNKSVTLCGLHWCTVVFSFLRHTLPRNLKILSRKSCLNGWNRERTIAINRTTWLSITMWLPRRRYENSFFCFTTGCTLPSKYKILTTLSIELARRRRRALAESTWRWSSRKERCPVCRVELHWEAINARAVRSWRSLTARSWVCPVLPSKVRGLQVSTSSRYWYHRLWMYYVRYEIQYGILWIFEGLRYTARSST